MTRLFFFIAAFCCTLAVGADDAPNAPIELASGAGTPPVLTRESTADEVLHACCAMLPTHPIEISGALIVRNRKGIVSAEHGYRLMMRHGRDLTVLTIRLTPRGETNETASVTIVRKSGERPSIRLSRPGTAETEVIESPLAQVLGTDVTWLDLTFDYLWWRNASFEDLRERESVHGQKCSVILVKPETPVEGLSAVRLWVDKRTGCLMQMEQVGANGQPLRRLWGTRVKKFGDRWMVSVLESETPGTRRRTKITIEGLRDL